MVGPCGGYPLPIDLAPRDDRAQSRDGDSDFAHGSLRRNSAAVEIAKGAKRLEQDGTLWLAAVNLILWSGLFLYLMRLDKKIGREEKDR